MYSVLIVDDDAYEREGIRRQLTIGKYGIDKIDVAENGLVALKKFEENPYDIVVSDVKMPVMDGVTMALRMQDIMPDVQLLFLSGYADFDFVQQAIQMHAYDYLLKPVGDKLEEKLEELTELLNEKRKLQRRQQTMSAANFQQQAVLGIELMDYFLCGQWNYVRRILENLNYLEYPYLVMVYGFQENCAEIEQILIQQELRKYLSAVSDSSLIGIFQGKLLLIYPTESPLVQKNKEMLVKEIRRGLQSFEGESWNVECVCCSGRDEIFNQMKILNERFAELSQKNSKAMNNSMIVKQLMTIVQSRYMEDLTIKQIADEVMYSPNYLSMLFKREIGQGFYDYLVSVRVNKAKKLLLEEQLKIYQIANAVGYEDAVAFIKRFRREVGCTPSQYRNEYQIKRSEI